MGRSEMLARMRTTIWDAYNPAARGRVRSTTGQVVPIGPPATDENLIPLVVGTDQRSAAPSQDMATASIAVHDQLDAALLSAVLPSCCDRLVLVREVRQTLPNDGYLLLSAALQRVYANCHALTQSHGVSGLAREHALGAGQRGLRSSPRSLLGTRLRSIRPE